MRISLRRLTGWCAAFAGLAVLHGAPPASAITVTSSADTDDGTCNVANCTLREAVVAANTNAAVDACAAGEPGPGTTDVILVPAGVFTLSIAGSGEDQAMTGDLDLTDSVSILGVDARQTFIDGGGIDRVFQVGNVAAAILDVTIRAGDAGGGSGGGVLNGGTLTLDGCTVEGNIAGGPGGGVRNNNDILMECR